MFEWDDGVIVNHIRRELGLTITGSQQPIGDEVGRADQQTIASKGRHRLIGRVAISSWAERKRLPPALACIVKMIDPQKRCRTQITNAVRRWQRGYMQQQAARPVFWRKQWRQPITLTHPGPPGRSLGQEPGVDRKTHFPFPRTGPGPQPY